MGSGCWNHPEDDCSDELDEEGVKHCYTMIGSLQLDSNNAPQEEYLDRLNAYIDTLRSSHVLLSKFDHW
jgi:hypothetical protein